MFRKKIDELLDFSKSPVLRLGLKGIAVLRNLGYDTSGAPLSENVVPLPVIKSTPETGLHEEEIMVMGESDGKIYHHTIGGKEIVHTVVINELLPPHKLPLNRIQTDRFPDEEKIKIMQELFSHYKPGYAWYDLGTRSGRELSGLVQEHRDSILEQTGAPGDFGCLEIHDSHFLPGFGLRVRDAVTIPARLSIGKIQAPLYLVNLTNPGFFGPNDIRVNFAEGTAYAPVDQKEFVESLRLEYRPCDRHYAITLVK